jgi:asparagine synthase (glutamine-hydrolysing)
VPGIHFIFSSSDLPREHQFNAAMDALRHDQDYERENVYRDKTSLLGITRYPEYPVSVYDNDEYAVLLEGRIYDLNKKRLSEELLKLAPLLFAEDKAARSQLRDWLLERDGEFLVLVRENATGAWGFMNDALGRLPVYIASLDGRFVLSREISFVVSFLKQRQPNRPAVAQQLLLGHPLGTRTLFEGIESVEPGSLLVWRSGEAVRREQLCRFNYEQLVAERSPAEHAARLANEFLSSCRRRTGDKKRSVIALSGGHDSRAVAAGLIQVGAMVQAVTFERASGEDFTDIEVARQVARTLGVDWFSLKVRRPVGSDVRELLKRKGGQNYTGVAFGIPYLHSVERRFGRAITYFTGDGGDKALPGLLPPRSFQSTEELARYVIERSAISPIAVVGRITNMTSTEITASLAAILGGYPEQSCSFKYVQFLLSERARRWLFEGEDRNRSFFWSTAPFYAVPFFRAAMAVPPRIKKRHRLYREFLRALDPRLIEVIDASRGMAIGSLKYRLIMGTASLLKRYPQFYARIVQKTRPPRRVSSEAAILKCISRQIKTCDEVAAYVDVPELRRYLDTPALLTRAGWHNLLTVCSTIERYISGGDSLRQFETQEFD